jgi:DEAD/DEAH box helicase domain-containing protein
MLGTIELARAASTVHPGAIYLHMGKSFEVDTLDLEHGRASLRSFAGDWYTQAKRETDTWIERVIESTEREGVTLHYGEVVVTETVTGFQRKRLRDHETIDWTPLDLPATEFATRAIWFGLEAEHLEGLEGEPLLGALHAAEHAQIAVLPLIAMCDRWDLGGLSTNLHPQTGGPTIFIHEGHPGGVGLTRKAFDEFRTLVQDARDLIGGCRCRSGCPSCVQSPKCGNLNEPLDKAGALAVLDRMLGG